MFFSDKLRNIKLTDHVLEIGPGASPFYRSDVLLEKKFSDEESLEQRGYVKSNLNNKDIVYYDGDVFPFKDDEFDYVICSHVLEHVDCNDMENFISEIQRVAKRGYLEYPTIYYDYLYNFKVHITLLNYKKNILYYCSKNKCGFSEDYEVTKLFYESLKSGYSELIDNNKQYFFQGFEWDGFLSIKKTDDINDLICNKIELKEAQYKRKNISSISRYRTKVRSLVKKITR